MPWIAYEQVIFRRPRDAAAEPAQIRDRLHPAIGRHAINFPRPPAGTKKAVRIEWQAFGMIKPIREYLETFDGDLRTHLRCQTNILLQKCFRGVASWRQWQRLYPPSRPSRSSTSTNTPTTPG